MLRPGVEIVGRDRREHDRIGPVPPLRHVARGLAHHRARPRLHIAFFAGAPIEPRQHIRRSGEEDVRLCRMRRHPSALAAADFVVVRAERLTRQMQRAVAATGHRHRRVVLLARDHVIREVGRGLDAVRLRGRIALRRPARSAVDRHHRAAVVAQHHARGVAWIDPQVVIVAVWCRDELIRCPAVSGLGQCKVQDVDRVRVVRVGDDAIEIERALPQIAIGVDQLPRGTGIVRSIESTGLGLDDGVEPSRIGARYRDANLAEQTLRHPWRVRHLRPRAAAVGGLEQSRARPAARELPRNARHFPQRCVQRLWILRIDDQIDRTGLRISEEHAAPRRAAVTRSIDAAGVARLRGIAERCRVDHIRVCWMHTQPGNGQRIGQPGMTPRTTGVDGLIDAVALHHVASQLRLAHTDVDHIGIRRRHGNRADRRAGDLAVSDSGPAGSPIDGLPQSASGGAEVVLEGSRRRAARGDRSAAAQRSDVAPLQRVERKRRRRRSRLGGQRPARKTGGNQGDDDSMLHAGPLGRIPEIRRNGNKRSATGAVMRLVFSRPPDLLLPILVFGSIDRGTC